MTVTVEAVDDPPRLDPIADQVTFSSSELSFKVTAFNPDQLTSAIKFSLADGSPAGAAIDPLTGQLTWTPSEEDAGQVTFDVVATNTASGLSASTPVNVQVVSAAALQALQEANTRRNSTRQQQRASVRRIVRDVAPLRRIRRGPSSSLNLGSQTGNSGISSGQVGVNTGVSQIHAPLDSDDVDGEKKDENSPRRGDRRSRRANTPDGKKQPVDQAKRANDAAVGQLGHEQGAVSGESLDKLAADQIELRRRAATAWRAPIVVAAYQAAEPALQNASHRTMVPARRQAVPVKVEAEPASHNAAASEPGEAAQPSAEQTPAVSAAFSTGEIITAAAIAGAIPLLVTQIKRRRRRPHEILRGLVHRLRD